MTSHTPMNDPQPVKMPGKGSDVNSLSLICTVTGSGAPFALFRTGAGEILKHHIGSMVGQDTLAAIEEGTITLAGGGKTRVMQLPMA